MDTQKIRYHAEQLLKLTSATPTISAVIPGDPPKAKGKGGKATFVLNGQTLDSFPGGKNFPEKHHKHTLRVVNHSGRQKVLRFEIKPGDSQWGHPGDKNKTKKRRAEITWRDEKKKLRLKKGQEGWSGFWVYLPSDPMANIRGCTIAQWHNNPAKGEMMQLVVDRGKIFAGGKNSEGKHFKKNEKALKPYLDKWLHVVTRLKEGSGKGGIRQIWINGKLFDEKRGGFKTTSRSGPYFKNGLYFWGYEKFDKTKHAVAYFDNVAVGPTRASVETS